MVLPNCSITSSLARKSSRASGKSEHFRFLDIAYRRSDLQWNSICFFHRIVSDCWWMYSMQANRTWLSSSAKSTCIALESPSHFAISRNCLTQRVGFVFAFMFGVSLVGESISFRYAWLANGPIVTWQMASSISALNRSMVSSGASPPEISSK